MLIYLILLLFMIASYFLTINKNNKSLFLIIILVLTFLSAFRNISVGTDTLMYSNYFNNVQYASWGNFLYNRFEPLFFYLCKIIGLISRKENFFLIVTSIIIIPSIGKFINNNSCNYILSCIIYFCLNLFFFNMTGLRQSISLAILIASYEFMKKGKNISSLFFIFIAIFFHKSSIIFLLAYLIYNRMKNRNKKLNLFFISILIMIFSYFFATTLFFMFTKFFTNYSSYVFSEHGASNYFGAVLQSLMYIFIYIFELLIYNHNFDEIKNKMIANFYLFMSLLASCFQIMSIKMTILGRCSIYFSIFSLLSIPFFLSTIRNSKKRLLNIFVILISLILYWGVIAIFRSNWNGAIPYVFYK